MSPGRRHVSRRAPTATRSASPAAWPMPSLMVLKLSRSRNRIASGSRAHASARERVLHAVDEQGAVGKPRQGVVKRLVLELLLERLPVGDVGEEPAPVRRRSPASRTTVASSRTQRTRPSRVSIRYSTRERSLLGIIHDSSSSACTRSRSSGWRRLHHNPRSRVHSSRGEPKQLLDPRAHVPPRPVGPEVRHVDDRRHVLEELAVPGLAGAQRARDQASVLEDGDLAGDDEHGQGGGAEHQAEELVGSSGAGCVEREPEIPPRPPCTAGRPARAPGRGRTRLSIQLAARRVRTGLEVRGGGDEDACSGRRTRPRRRASPRPGPRHRPCRGFRRRSQAGPARGGRWAADGSRDGG